MTHPNATSLMKISPLVFLLCVAGQAVSLLAADRPNFVWLISEDNSKHYLRLFDEHGAETPHIARLAADGLLFEHAFSNSPVCSVARTTLITGCYAPRIGTQFHRRLRTVPLPGNLRMFPAYLREAGYHTTNRQKKDYNAVEGAGVWDESSAQATWRDRRAGQPFFHMRSFGTTHESSLHFSEAEMQAEATETDPDQAKLAPYHPDTPTFRYTVARYHDRIRQMDGQIGEVVSQLEEDGLLEDTFVFYFGDHGGVLPRSKGYIYESGLHVPLVVRVPENWRHIVDARPGSHVTGFVSFVDFGPTLLNLAGLSIPQEMDGRPFLGNGVSLSDVNAREEAFGYADRFDEKYDFVRTWRSGRFKYMRSYQPFNFDALQNNYRYRMLAYAEWRELFHAGKLNPAQSQFFQRRPAEALYDLDADPHEVHDLSGDPEYADTLARLRTRLAEHVKNLPDLSFYPESFLINEPFENPTAFGQGHRREISMLVEIADLSLVPFPEAQGEIEAALEFPHPWERYWGLITCSSHGEESAPLAEIARRLAAQDPELLVRVRAAEFLGLIGAEDPRPVLRQALATTRSGAEANLMLNSLILLRDGQPGYAFPVKANWFRSNVAQEPYVQRRLEYLLAPR